MELRPLSGFCILWLRPAASRQRREALSLSRGPNCVSLPGHIVWCCRHRSAGPSYDREFRATSPISPIFGSRPNLGHTEKIRNSIGRQGIFPQDRYRRVPGFLISFAPLADYTGVVSQATCKRPKQSPEPVRSGFLHLQNGVCRAALIQRPFGFDSYCNPAGGDGLWLDARSRLARLRENRSRQG